MFIIPIQKLDEIANDHFGSGDAQTQSTNDEAGLPDEEERDDLPDWLGKKWKYAFISNSLQTRWQKF